MTSGPRARESRVLLVSDCAPTAAALTSLLAGQGYEVSRACTAREAWASVRTRAPSAVILDGEMPDMPAVELCRRLHGEWDHAASLPVLLVNGVGARRLDRLTAYGAGAWNVSPAPLDGMLFLLALQTFVQARHTWMHGTERTDSADLDAETGSYALSGMLRRASEVQAAAARHGEPVACIAFAVEPSEGENVGASAEAIARICRTRLRASDVFGRIGPTEFAIMATDADAEAAERLVGRLRLCLEEASAATGAPSRDLRAVSRVVGDCADPAANVADSLLWLVSAMRNPPSAVTVAEPRPAAPAAL